MDAPRLPDKYYQGLHLWYRDGGSGKVVRFLLDYDLTGFNPKAPAPATGFKAEIQASSKSSLKYKIEDLIDGFDPPFEKDVVRTKDIEKAFQYKWSSMAIAGVLREMGCLQRECKDSADKGGGRGTYSLYAVRDQAHWSKREMKDWVFAYKAE